NGSARSCEWRAGQNCCKDRGRRLKSRSIPIAAWFASAGRCPRTVRQPSGASAVVNRVATGAARREKPPGFFVLSAGYRGTAGLPGLWGTHGDRAARGEGKSPRLLQV